MFENQFTKYFYTSGYLKKCFKMASEGKNQSTKLSKFGLISDLPIAFDQRPGFGVQITFTGDFLN